MVLVPLLQMMMFFFWQLQLLGAEKRKISGRLRLKLKLQGKCQNVLGGQWQARRMNDGNRQSFQMFRDSPAAGKSSPLSEDFFQAKTDNRLVARRNQDIRRRWIYSSTQMPFEKLLRHPPQISRQHKTVRDTSRHRHTRANTIQCQHETPQILE